MRDFNSNGMLVGRPKQEVFFSSTTQLYPIGMIHERHGKRWRYCQALEEILGSGAGRGCPNMSIVPGDTGGSTYGIEKNFYASVPLGADTVEIENNGSTCWPVDYFVGGQMNVFSTGDAPGIFTCRVSGNELFTATSGIVYLDERIPVDCSVEGTGWGTGGYGVNLHPSPYKNVGASGSGSVYRSYVVVPTCNDIAAGSFFWGQTRGPCWVTPNAYGDGRIKVFHTNGTIVDRTDGSLAQIAGIAIPADYDGGYGDGNIILQLE